MKININESVYAKTHAEFLNKKFGTNYNSWMKCVYPINAEYEVWMIRFDGKIRDGWRNSYLGDVIKDENCEKKPTWDGMPVSQTLYRKKLVFEILDCGKDRLYIFKGVYKYSEQESNPYQIRVYRKILDSYGD